MIRSAFACLALLAGPDALLAQGAPPPKPPQAVDPVLAKAQASFEALPEADRKAIQTDLIWGGDFSGTASGSFGSLTFNAIKAFQRGLNQPPDGVLTPQSRKLLADAAKRMRDQARFAIMSDSRSGAQIGIPQAILPRQAAGQAGMTRWQSADDKVTLDMRVGQPGETLEGLFEKSSAAAPGRKITYKLLRPDFYVVTGETDQGRFYIRMAKSAQGALRGFSIGYDKSLAATADRLVIAIANSFDPFPSGPVPKAPQAQPGQQPQQLASAPQAAPAKPTERQATGLRVAGGLVVTAAAAVDACKSISASGRPATLTKREGGLALLTITAPAGQAAPLHLRGGNMDAALPLVVLSVGEPVPGQRAPMAIPADIRTGTSGPMIEAPLQPGGAGSAAFDRQGSLAGLVTGTPSSAGAIAGTVPARRYGLTAAPELAKFLAANGVTLGTAEASADLTVGQIVQQASSGVVAISCAL